ncbi:putrescine/spermidine ABC transporter ATPase [Azospirillum thiophilum]|uniref:Putrescine/spermidine ABC transporter ATPase n=1 Tax=Azospirillum thiophilum TaxID=528244 RepID=A0AAC8VZI9_9PROT|nr:ABC transporter ATP-binding protein [Azospirillum thiophilum]ALG72267.1 putrescine/spermidine ABC transporter ATPase [Azospirillum thiophilum]KJR64019.1 putrescine/spermidine ABC transporter ATPase [Azospirillum thiophilum]
MAELHVEDLTVAYGGSRVLDGVSLHVRPGEFVALLGSSGCGKTTLLRAVSGFVPVDGGRIAIAGQDVTRAPPERRDTAMVFQSYALWPHMTTAQNIGYGLKLRRWPRPRIAERVAEMLRLLKLDGLADRNVTQLSGGQRQRVALGRALAVKPDILLLDEPLSNLDARIRLELRHEIRALQQRLGITAVHVTHDREEAMVMADRIVILNAGTIAQIGTPEEIYRRPASPFVASFLGADNVVTLHAVRTAGALEIAAGPDHDAVRLPLGDDRAYGAATAEGPVDAHFRTEAARLAAPGAVPADALVLRGRITQTAYPGGRWRYGVAVGGTVFLVDDDERRTVGDAVAIVIQPSALHCFPARRERPEATPTIWPNHLA